MKNPSAKWQKNAARLLGKVIREVALIEKVPPKNRDQLFIDLSFVSAETMIFLNHQYRKKKTMTDVLSFPSSEIFRQSGFLGEIIICYPVLQKQALERNLSEEMELLILLVHGVLHLFGWDHEKSKNEAKKMALLEIKILNLCAPQLWIKKSKGLCLRGLIERVE